MAPTSKQAKAVLQTLGSLRLAVIVLGTLAVVLAIATIIESKVSPAAARHFVYGSAWFSLVLLVLGINVAAAALTRWPWRARHIGFLITHAGILVILGGCLGTNRFGINGRLALQQGTQDNHIVLDDWVITAMTGSPGQQRAAQIPIGQPPHLAAAPAALDLPGRQYHLRLLQYLPDAEERAQVIDGSPQDPAAVLLEIQAAGQSGQQWLLADDTGRWSIRTPGFTLAMFGDFSPQTAPVGKGTVVVTIDGQSRQIDVEQALAAPIDIGDGHTTLRVTEYYEHTRVEGHKLYEDPTQPANPAVVLELASGDTRQTRIVFAQFGDIGEMSAMHKDTPASPIKVALEHPRSATLVALVPRQNSLTIYEQDGGEIAQQIDLPLDKPVTLRKMAMTLTARKFLPHARASTVIVPRQPGQPGDPQPAVQVELTGDTAPQRTWLLWAQPASLTLGPDTLDLMLQANEVELPFAIRLDRFDVEDYPNTQMPAMFRSSVTLIDTQRHEQHKVQIEMNRPLQYRGWSFFQNSYSIDPQHRQRVSVLAASKDPGKPILFTGALLLVAGTVILSCQRLVPQRPGTKRPAPPTNGSPAQPSPGKVTSQ